MFQTPDIKCNKWRSSRQRARPTLFLLYINNVCDLFADLSVAIKLYADDIKLYSHCEVSSSCDLDSAIDQLYDWSNTWQLQIAVDKCFVCCLSTKKCVTHKNYSVN